MLKESYVVKCPKCGGSGDVASNICDECHGNGWWSDCPECLSTWEEGKDMPSGCDWCEPINNRRTV